MAGPMHAEVADELRGEISSGAIAVGESMPSETRLVRRFGVSRGTVRRALSTLRHEGLIGGGQGRPPVVRERAIAQSFETFLSFSAWARGMGREPGQRLIELALRGAGAAAADALDVEEGTPVVELLRLRTLDGEPAMLERSSFAEQVGRLLFDRGPDDGSIYAYLIGHGADLRNARHTIDAVAASESDARLLGTAPGSPLLRERRRVSGLDGRPLEYGEDRYRPDVVTFTVDNARPSAHGGVAEVRVLKQSS
ncbi:MAG: GntR family transcriptional regulator [Nocardioidaceae bacterium]